jgi:hypothetical protein
LTPVWVSRDMVNPAPPVIANGVVVVLSSGDAKTHATLYVLNAATGAELYSSKDAIPTYAHFSGVSLGDSHVFFTDRNNTLYSFGIGMEHWLVWPFASALAEVVLVRDYFRVEEGRERAADLLFLGVFWGCFGKNGWHDVDLWW